ncbi:MAG: hypothetical protein WCQ49_00660 [Candidatus Saccharibacteria bacterium]
MTKESVIRKAKYILTDILFLLFSFQGFYLIYAWKYNNLRWFEIRLRNWEVLSIAMFVWVAIVILLFVFRRTIFRKSKIVTPVMIALLAYMIGFGTRFW